ncbi:hypothetical protein A3715_27865 [Oleiphilus sp. HI0009]|nr:hypothetical protein A3715_15160 [Oleiphilus sp. HI0009]KZX85684.1 hypothetical protein A3715_27865 [Oleiphilus sp. HI0009]KZY63467.1 hypothetical protein A3738_11795 [Oleiphilus sp. HI0066]KZY70874.1 hypothetical protein A3739_05755 [Oleiphilus sp. HI0067]KZZ57292.1 hypothetical protein A3762_01330 [Oleiphilus sp. HI0125]
MCSFLLLSARCKLQTEHFHWHSYRRVPSSFIPRVWQSWVLDAGSLTKRLQQASNGSFKVRVKAQQYAKPTMSERRALNLSIGRYALIREVDLLCHDKVWVSARSVIPLHSLVGKERQLKCLGSKPLGAFLFASRSMKREAIQLTRTSGGNQPTYARRSVFRLHNKPLLVAEKFHTSVIHHS